MTKTLLPTISDEMSSDDMKSAKLHFESLGFSMPGWAKASRERKVAWLRKTLTEAMEMPVEAPRTDAVLPDGTPLDLKTVEANARGLGRKMMDFTAAVIKFVMGEQTSPDTSIPLLGRLMVKAKMNFASGLRQDHPGAGVTRAATRLALEKQATKVRLSDAEDAPISRQVRRHMLRIAQKLDRTERKEEAMASRALGGAAAVV